MEPLNNYDRTSILSEDVFTEIFEQQDEILKARLLLSCQDRARELGVKGQFDKLVAAYKTIEKTDRSRSVSMVENYTNFSSHGKYDNMLCGSWIASDDGIFTYSKDYTNTVVVCYHPILPIERMKNLETGEEQIKLAYRRNRAWREIIVPKDLVSSANKIVSLSKQGIAVTSENAKNMVKYLSDVENLNEEEIPVQSSSSKLGWIGDGFIPYDKDVVFDGDMRFKSICESIAEHGDEDMWLNLAKDLRSSGKTEINIFLAASFASVLVRMIGALPFIIDLWGETEGGKSVTMMLAASVWANPGENKYIGDFKTTDVALEAKNNLLNHLPLLLDDSSKVSSRIRDNFEGVVYDLCSGKGKSRSNKDIGMQKENHWCNAILTNGERPLSSYVSQGGAINRIMELESSEHVYDNPQYVADTVKQHYGFAGQRFVEIIKEMGADEVKRIQRQIQEEIYDDEVMQKQSISLSIILTADKIATEQLFKDGQYIDRSDAKKLLINKNELSENERCYQYIQSEISVNILKFDEDAPSGEIWGKVSKGYACIYLNVFDRMCEKGHFSKKSFLKWAEAKDLLEFDKGRNNKTIRIKSKPTKCICLKLEEEDESAENTDEKGFVPPEDEEQTKLPFD